VLFDACSAHWAAANPPPDIGAWAAVKAPDERLGVALEELYAYYGRNERMLDNLFRDETISPFVAERFAAFHAYLAAAQDVLLQGRRLRGAARRQAKAAIGHAIAFSTWKSLVREQGLPDADAVAMMCALAGPAG
jgi:hypothetical protein